MRRGAERRDCHHRPDLNFVWKGADDIDAGHRHQFGNLLYRQFNRGGGEKFADQSAVGNGGLGAHGVTDAETVAQTGEINTAGTKACVDDRRGGQQRAFKRFKRAVPARRVRR